MKKFEVDRAEADRIGWNSGNVDDPGSHELFEQNRMILSVLLDLRDLAMPEVTGQDVFDPKKFSNDLGPGTVEFCTDKAALCHFEREDLGELFVPFSRMPPGMQQDCEDEKPFTKFFLGDWIYGKLLEQAKEDRHLKPEGTSRPDGSPLSDGDIPF
jgi:hypothetical protein